jgi:hypothetical protein
MAAVVFRTCEIPASVKNDYIFTETNQSAYPVKSWYISGGLPGKPLFRINTKASGVR